MSGKNTPYFIAMSELGSLLGEVTQIYEIKSYKPKEISVLSYQMAQVASAYAVCVGTVLSALPYQGEWIMSEDFLASVQEVKDLYRTQDFPGVLQQTYALLSALPGDPGAIPISVPPPPKSDD